MRIALFIVAVLAIVVAALVTLPVHHAAAAPASAPIVGDFALNATSAPAYVTLPSGERVIACPGVYAS